MRDQDAHMSKRTPWLFYGWVVAAVSGLGLAAGISVFLPSTIGLLIAPLGREFGWSPPQVLAALTFNTVTTLIAAPITGRFVDRLGARKVILFAFACEALLIASFNIMSDNIALFYVRYMLFAALATGSTAISYSALISLWFDRRRGLALGITLAGVGLGGVIWSLMAQYLFDTVGWRNTMLYVAAVIAFAIIPLQLLVIRNRPEEMGLAKDGAAIVPVAAGAEGPPLDGLTVAEAIRTGRFWLVITTFFLMTFAAYGVTLNLVTILTRQGVSPQLAAAAQASVWLAILPGRAFTGWFLDRFFAPRVALVAALPAIAGIAILATGGSGSSAYLAAMLVGLAAGAEIDVLAYVIGRYFGLRHFGAIYALNFGAAAVATSTGPVLAATIAQANGGSYGAALATLAGLLVLACVLLLMFPRFPARFTAAH